MIMATREIGACLFSRIMACFVLMIISSHELSSASSTSDDRCPPSSCGNLHNITYPFRLATDPYGCGIQYYELSCQNDKPVILIRDEYYNYVHGSEYYVEAINYSKGTIRLFSPKSNRSSLSILPFRHKGVFESEIRISKAGFSRVHRLVEAVTFLRCEKLVQNPFYRTLTDNSVVSNFEGTGHFYAVVGKGLRFSDLEESCRFEFITWISPRNGTKLNTYREIQNEISYGFEISWAKSFCLYERYPSDEYYLSAILNKYNSPIDYLSSHCSRCYFDEDSNQVNCWYTEPAYTPDTEPAYSPYTVQECDFWCRFPKELYVVCRDGRVYFEVLSVPRIVCAILVIALLAYKCKRRHLSVHDGIEEFLESNNNLIPVRYSYWEIIVMTRGFREKLGEGGFGSVYKGKLSGGRLVAVKLLNKSKANGQDFINEVATTGKIHHVNVVQLIGFCFAGSKRALIYKFMPNGSLDNYVFLREGITKLISHSELFEISLGVARGIEYLHQGCDMQILHFDIKPHNILLDENFIPKVSDFGLARLCPLDNSIVPLTAVRGTMGYIAPELFYKNIGHVSHKADVYSFGMLLMEMASRRRNLNAVADKSSQIFYPLWVYDQLNEDKDMTMENVAGEDLKAMKKMIIVALWCIQMKPCNRPSLSKDIEMLEGEVESLEMPPKPYLNPYENNGRENQNAEEGTEEPSATSSSVVSDEDSPEISLVSSNAPFSS